MEKKSLAESSYTPEKEKGLSFEEERAATFMRTHEFMAQEALSQTQKLEAEVTADGVITKEEDDRLTQNAEDISLEISRIHHLQSSLPPNSKMQGRINGMLTNMRRQRALAKHVDNRNNADEYYADKDKATKVKNLDRMKMLRGFKGTRTARPTDKEMQQDDSMKFTPEMVEVLRRKKERDGR